MSRPWTLPWRLELAYKKPLKAASHYKFVGEYPSLPTVFARIMSLENSGDVKAYKIVRN